MQCWKWESNNRKQTETDWLKRSKGQNRWHTHRAIARTYKFYELKIISRYGFASLIRGRRIKFRAITERSDPLFTPSRRIHVARYASFDRRRLDDWLRFANWMIRTMCVCISQRSIWAISSIKRIKKEPTMSTTILFCFRTFDERRLHTQWDKGVSSEWKKREYEPKAGDELCLCYWNSDAFCC